MKHHHIIALRVLGFLSALVLSTSLHAALPTSGLGWTLVEDGTGGYTISDDVDTGQGWVADLFIKSSSNKGGLTPVTGATFLYGERGSKTENYGAYKYFDDSIKVQAGTYTITFSVGNMSDTTYRAPYTAFLIADDEKGALYSHRIVASEANGVTIIKDSPTPDAGEWVTFTYTWSITGDSDVIGKTLGFGIQDSYYNTAYAFDNLVITYTPAAIPEPATTGAIFAGGVFIFMAFTRSRRHD